LQSSHPTVRLCTGDDVFVLTVVDLDLGGPEIVFDVLVADN
jgi:hypothetical protein